MSCDRGFHELVGHGLLKLEFAVLVDSLLTLGRIEVLGIRRCGRGTFAGPSIVALQPQPRGKARRECYPHDACRAHGYAADLRSHELIGPDLADTAVLEVAELPT